MATTVSSSGWYALYPRSEVTWRITWNLDAQTAYSVDVSGKQVSDRNEVVDVEVTRQRTRTVRLGVYERLVTVRSYQDSYANFQFVHVKHT